MDKSAYSTHTALCSAVDAGQRTGPATQRHGALSPSLPFPFRLTIGVVQIQPVQLLLADPLQVFFSAVKQLPFVQRPVVALRGGVVIGGHFSRVLHCECCSRCDGWYLWVLGGVFVVCCLLTNAHQSTVPPLSIDSP